jgi:RNA-dependent RNA polymerase
MEIQLKNVERLATSYDVTRAIAKVLHGRSFVTGHYPQQSRPINFSVTLSPDTVPNSIRNGGSGTLTIPFLSHAKQFLAFLVTRRLKIKVHGRAIHFYPSHQAPKHRVLDTLAKVFAFSSTCYDCLIPLPNQVPYQDPDIIETNERIIKELIAQLPIRTLQFGVLARRPGGYVFSPEWEEDYQEQGDARLAFEYQHKLLRLKIGDHSDTIAHSVVITFTNMKKIYYGWEYGEPCESFNVI